MTALFQILQVRKAFEGGNIEFDSSLLGLEFK